MSKPDARRFPIEIALKDYRAIKEADVLLDGIAIVAGENGCGKSTLSRILYYFFKTSTSYEQLVAKQFWSEMKNVLSLLLAYRYDRSFPNTQSEFYRSLIEIRRAKDANELSESICDTIVLLLENIKKLAQDEQNNGLSQRFLLIAGDVLDFPRDKMPDVRELMCNTPIFWRT